MKEAEERREEEEEEEEGRRCTCSQRLVQISRRRSVPALAELGPQLVVRRLLAVQHLQRLKEAKQSALVFFLPF